MYARRCVAMRCAACTLRAARRFAPKRSAHDRRRAAACSVVAAPYREMNRRAARWSVRHARRCRA